MTRLKNNFTQEEIAAFKAKIKALPPVAKKPKNLNKTEAVRAMASEIRFAQKIGYGLEDIASQLTEGGMAISAATLKNYLQRTKTQKKVASAHQEPAASSPTASTAG
ncbi:hypothetical protein LMG28614_06016 [Paraburkholderia ultramafica]|uniref:Protein mobC n=1 Tax=Paraburkholderia ultramafica TaxID=1544867 RepID=A0A6S7D2I1_9BURK|nr:hypothetical protein [Paraburkholderia ultramafica]CAB3804356.1 hypothetical protein LMG28614_06016 [Paraburkholderia ultramafica]